MPRVRNTSNRGKAPGKKILKFNGPPESPTPEPSNPESSNPETSNPETSNQVKETSRYS